MSRGLKAHCRALLPLVVASLAGMWPVAAQTPGGSGGFVLPSISVRKVDPRAGRVLAPNVLGWRLGVRTDVVAAPTFLEALAVADAAGLAFVEASGNQKVSPAIQKPLNQSLTAAEITMVKARLDELRLRVTAYRLNELPAGIEERRNAFAFGKSLGAMLIVVPAEPAAFTDLDKLAADLDVHVAIVARDAKAAFAALTARSDRLGLEIGPSSVAAIPGRVKVLAFGKGNTEAALIELSRQQPPAAPVDYPPPPGHDGGGAKQKLPSILIAIEPRFGGTATELMRTAAAFDAAVRPFLRAHVDRLAKLTPISTPENVPSDQRERVAAAVPQQAAATPKKPRKLLVLDLAYNGSFYHGSTPLGNLSLQLMSERTHAFTAVFSNDLENLHYPKIKQFDGVFLNQIQGDVFDDDLAIEGLTRYVREGGGVGGLHAATWASQNVPQFGELMGATSGAHKYNGEQGAIYVDDPSSPLTRSFDRRAFEFFDEFYHYIPTGPFSRETLHVLLSLDPARKDVPANVYTTRPDGDYGLVWIRRYGSGRVFNVGLGHRPEFYENGPMQRMLLAGVQFVLGDLDADTTPSAVHEGRR